MNHWNPILFQNQDLVPTTLRIRTIISTTDLAQEQGHCHHDCVRPRASHQRKPYFLYVATGATRPASHAAGVDRAVQGKFDGGWDPISRSHLRAAEAARRGAQGPPKPGGTLQGASGVEVPQRASQRHLTPDSDGGVCRLRGALLTMSSAAFMTPSRKLPDADNTVIIFIAGMANASRSGVAIEGSLQCENMFFNGLLREGQQDHIEAIDELGGPKRFNRLSVRLGPRDERADSSGPEAESPSHFRRHSQAKSFISWPARIKDKGGLRTQFLRTIDIVPTLYEICRYPRRRPT